MWWILMYGIYFVFDRIQNKLMCRLMYSTTKAIRYTKAWEDQNRTAYDAFLDWVFVS